MLSSTIVITSHSLFWINPLVQLVACTAGVLLWRFHRMGMRLSLAVQALQLFQLKTTLATLGFKPGLAYWLSASLEPTSLDARYSDSVLRVNLAAVIVLGVLIWYAYRYPGLVEEDGKSAV